MAPKLYLGMDPHKNSIVEFNQWFKLGILGADSDTSVRIQAVSDPQFRHEFKPLPQYRQSGLKHNPPKAPFSLVSLRA